MHERWSPLQPDYFSMLPGWFSAALRTATSRTNGRNGMVLLRNSGILPPRDPETSVSSPAVVFTSATDGSCVGVAGAGRLAMLAIVFLVTGDGGGSGPRCSNCPPA